MAAAVALSAPAAEPLYVFDNGAGRGVLSIEEQVELARRTGYAGVFMSGTKDMPAWLAAHKSRGMRFVGIYTGADISKENATFDPGLPEAIRQLKGSGTLITFTVNGKAADGDARAVPIVRQVADMAAAAGLEVALYPHYGFHVARIEDALRVREKVGRPNVGIVFNLCHWLRSGDAANLAERLRQAIPYTRLVSINGADSTGDWDRLIQPLGRGDYDVQAFVRAVRAAGYRGPIGLQCYNVKGDREENLKRSMAAWRTFR
jgi:sugar phosphate isomerase/epimerase